MPGKKLLNASAYTSEPKYHLKYKNKLAKYMAKNMFLVVLSALRKNNSIDSRNESAKQKHILYINIYIQ